MTPTLHPKQDEFISSKKRYKLLNWGRRCFTPDTPVLLSDGRYKAIRDICIGDSVCSFNIDTKQLEAKPVLNNYRFGVDYDPKPMLELQVNNKVITCTYDHEFYHKGEWIPAYQLAWGTMEPSKRLQLKLLCQHYGTGVDDLEAWWNGNSRYETSKRQKRVSENSYGRQDSQSSQGGGSDLDSKPSEQTTSEPQGQRQRQQQNRKPGMGDTPRECCSLCSPGTTDTKSWGTMWDPQAEGTGGYSNQETSGTISEPIKSISIERASETVPPSETRLDSRHFEVQDLEAYCIRVLESDNTHDLEVFGNHNYIVDGILVHNSGKTFAVGYEIFIALWENDNGLVSYYAPTRDDARNISWDDYKTLLADITISTNESLLEIVTKNKHGTKSTLRLAGWEAVKNRDKGRGVENNLVILDEVAFFPAFEDKFNKVIRPTLLTSKGRLIMTSTPNGFNHFYDWYHMAVENDDWFVSHCTSYDNPFNEASEIDKIKKESDPDAFAQEYMADFRRLQGLVYPEYDHERHKLQEFPVHVDRRLTKQYGCLDFGHTNPAAMYTVDVTEDREFYISNEFYERGKLHSELAEQAQSRNIKEWFPDPADAEGCEVLRRSGLTIKEVSKEVTAGINTVKKLLRENRLYFVDCPHLEFEINQYQWQETGSSKINLNDPEAPIKENDHALDAIRYALHMLETRSNQKVEEFYQRLKNKPHFNPNKKGRVRAGLK